MWESFVDNVMDSAYTRQSPAPPANDKVSLLHQAVCYSLQQLSLATTAVILLQQCIRLA